MSSNLPEYVPSFPDRYTVLWRALLDLIRCIPPENHIFRKPARKNLLRAYNNDDDVIYIQGLIYLSYLYRISI